MSRSSAAAPRSVFPWMTSSLCLGMLLLHYFAGPQGGDPGYGSQRLALLDAGAKSASLVSDAGEGWRVLSAHVVHTGWLHLLFNMAFLFPVAAALECVLERVDFALTMVAIAICSGLASLIWTPEISAGASGLVYGVLGCAVLVGLRFGSRLRGRLRLHFGVWVLPFLLLILLFGANNPNLDHHNHLGGLVAGLAVVPFLRLRRVFLGVEAPAPNASATPVRLLTTLVLVGLTVVATPSLVRQLQPAHQLRCMDAWMDLPPSWGDPNPESACEPTGLPAQEATVPNSSTMVTLGLARLPRAKRPRQSWLHAWQLYRERFIDPRAPEDSIFSWSHDCPQARQIPAHADARSEAPDHACTQGLTFVREGVPMQAEVRWYPRQQDWLSVRFEAPVHWWDKYAPIRRSILDSVQPRAPRDHLGGPRNVVRAAIP